MKFWVSALVASTTLLSLWSQDHLNHNEVKYGAGLSEYGSEKPAFTIYTNPAEDCTSSMNISWATRPGMDSMIEVVDESDYTSYLYYIDEELMDWDITEDSLADSGKYKYPYIYKCATFNDIPSKLIDNSSVIEKHIFDKHGYELFGLEPNRNYSYRIVTVNESTGEEEYSEFYRFKTAGAENWKAAVIGDFHHYSPLWSRIDSAMGMIDVLDRVSGGIDWVLSVGDEVAYGGSYNYWTELSEQPNTKHYMWASVQGNHDNMAADKSKSDNYFRDSHYFPQNGYEGQEGVTYWFKYGDVLFLMLNNEAMHQKNGHEPAIEWMKQVVEENPSKYIVVVEHYEWIIGTNGQTSQIRNFESAFDEMGVDLAISGNNHVYLRTCPLKYGERVLPEEGTYYVVNPSSDNGRGRDMKRLVANSDIIESRWSEGTHTIGGMVMDVNPNRIQMTLYDRYGQIQDTFVVPAKR